MCGIAGMLTGDAGHPALDRVESVTSLLVHRGPDDHGFLSASRTTAVADRVWRPAPGATAALIHLRLSILDLSANGWQPMQTRDGAISLVLNGEVYNFIELRAKLEALGHTFRSESDTEVVLAAYAQWGTRAFEMFTGMFAIALLDLRNQCLVLARDPFGIKPLYYTRENGALFFASELPALLEFAASPRRVDAQRLYRFLRYGVTDGGDGTLLSGVRQLPAASFARIAFDSPLDVQPETYWQPSGVTNRDISFGEAAGELRRRFLRSVELHLRSDVPVGAALSGGIDSSAIVAAIRAVAPASQIHAFSYVASGTPFDEERWVDMAASAAGANVHKVYPEAHAMQAELQTLSAIQGEPFGSTSIYAQYRVFSLAAQNGIKVMLDGQGADELLGGYRQYLGARLASLIRAGRIPEARAFLKRASQQPGAPASYLLQKAAEHLLPDGIQAPLRKLVGRETMPSWMNGAWFKREGVAPMPLVAGGGQQVLKSALLADLAETSLPALLRYEDRNSMAFSIESRVPFLTTDIVDFVLTLPEEYLIGPDGLTKRVFREAMRGLVPDPILERRDKIGFATPERDWLKSLDAWIRPMIDGLAAREIPALNPDDLRTLWDETLYGSRRFDFHLWRVFNVIYWTEQFSVTYA